MRLRVRAFAHASRWAGRVLRAADALHQGWWLGWMDPPDLHAVTERWYDRHSPYGSSTHNRSGLVAWEERALDRHFAACRSVLVGGAGGGREVLALVRRGISVEAFDCSVKLVDACRRLLDEEGHPGTVRLSPPDEVPATVGRFEGVVVGWGAYMHVAGRERRVRFLRALARHVPAGGPVLISFFVRSQETWWFHWVRRVAAFVRRMRRSREPVELGDALPGTFDHHFAPEEVRGELEAGGFDLVSLDTRPYGHAVGRKRPDAGDSATTPSGGGAAR